MYRVILEYLEVGRNRSADEIDRKSTHSFNFLFYMNYEKRRRPNIHSSNTILAEIFSQQISFTAR